MTPGRDRLRELLDAVLEEDHATLADMAGGAHSSPHHFVRRLRRDAGEPPVAMRRRVVLERAAWQLRQGWSVTDAAWAAGYDSVEGFSRAFARAYGQPPSSVARGDGRTGHWLPAPNGIHFHPPTSLWVEGGDGPTELADLAAVSDPVTLLLVRHDLDDTLALLTAAATLPPGELARPRLAGHRTLDFDGEDASLADVLHHVVWSKEVWLASIEGHDLPREPAPPADASQLPALVERHHAVAGRWLAVLRDIERRDGWGDRLVDALCDPPQSFLLAGVVAHVLSFSAARRGLARQLLRAAGVVVPHGHDGDGDPLSWLARRSGGTP